jgi:hypothetical protein
MKTRGINSESEITKAKQKAKGGSKEIEELFLKSMMISCFAYGGISEDSHNYERYLLKYKTSLGEKLFNQVYKEQADYLEGFEVESCTYIDSEGARYNSLAHKK